MAVLSLMHIIAYADELVWSEEFNSGSVPDETIWSYDLGATGWGNRELQEYTDSTNNVRVADGHLIISALRQGNNFTSGRVKTQDKLTFTYGTVEARIQIPDLADGLWPAFWTLGNSISSIGWPACGEIDVMEMGNISAISDGVVNRRVGSTAHWEYGGSHVYYGLTLDRPSDLDGSFHIYRLEWTPDEIKTYIDDVHIWTIDISGGADSDLEEFHLPHFFVLNLAVGGTYTGRFSPSEITAEFPAEYKIDYVRIYDNGYTVLGGASSRIPDTNLLDNPNMEEGLTGWNLNLSGGSASVSSAHAHQGAQSLVIDSRGAGDWSSPNTIQTFIAEPGDLFNMRGYLLNPSSMPIQGASFGLFKIEFRNSSGALLEPENIFVGSPANAPWFGAESTPLLNAASPEDEWIFSEVQAEAPEGTAEVQFTILNVNEPGNAGLIYYDDMMAVLIGDPIVPMLDLTGSGFSFSTQIGYTYDLMHKSSMTNANWMFIQSIAGDGQTNTVIYSTAAPQGFYRIQIP